LANVIASKQKENDNKITQPAERYQPPHHRLDPLDQRSQPGRVRSKSMGACPSVMTPILVCLAVCLFSF
jgi:hypothetical protein